MLCGALQVGSRLLDGNFSPDGQSFVLCDSLGYFSIYGSGVAPQSLREQFFRFDYDDLIRDSRGFVQDANQQIEPHLMRRQLADSDLIPYPSVLQPTGIGAIVPIFLPMRVKITLLAPRLPPAALEEENEDEEEDDDEEDDEAMRRIQLEAAAAIAGTQRARAQGARAKVGEPQLRDRLAPAAAAATPAPDQLPTLPAIATPAGRPSSGKQCKSCAAPALAGNYGFCQVTGRNTAFPCASAVILPKTDAFPCAAAVHHSPCSKHRLSSSIVALITSHLMPFLVALQAHRAALPSANSQTRGLQSDWRRSPRTAVSANETFENPMSDKSAAAARGLMTEEAAATKILEQHCNTPAPFVPLNVPLKGPAHGRTVDFEAVCAKLTGDRGDTFAKVGKPAEAPTTPNLLAERVSGGPEHSDQLSSGTSRPAGAASEATGQAVPCDKNESVATNGAASDAVREAAHETVQEETRTTVTGELKHEAAPAAARTADVPAVKEETGMARPAAPPPAAAGEVQNELRKGNVASAAGSTFPTSSDSAMAPPSAAKPLAEDVKDEAASTDMAIDKLDKPAPAAAPPSAADEQGQRTWECRYRFKGCQSRHLDKASEYSHASTVCKFRPDVTEQASAESKPEPTAEEVKVGGTDMAAAAELAESSSDAFPCAAAVHHSPCSKHRLSSSMVALITSHLCSLSRQRQSRGCSQWV